MNEHEQFESFCWSYNLEYDFETLGKGNIYKSEETHKAFIIFKYSWKYNDCKE